MRNKSQNRIQYTPSLPHIRPQKLTPTPSLLLSPQIIQKSRQSILMLKEVITRKKKRGKEVNDNNNANNININHHKHGHNYKQLDQSFSSSQSDTSRVIKRIDSGRQPNNLDCLPKLTVIQRNRNKQQYLQMPFVKQALVGEEAVNRFYLHYKTSLKQQDKQQFLHQSNILTRIASLLEGHFFTPRRLDVIKLQGQQAILDLRKLGLGQGTMGPVVAEIIIYLDRFQEVNLSGNRIDGYLGEQFIERLGKTKRIDLSHNRIGKMGCSKFAQLFMTNTTKILELSLMENSLLDNAGEQLLMALPKYQLLRKLNLSRNYLGTRSAAALKQLLGGGGGSQRYSLTSRTQEKTCALTELYLSWNEFNQKAVAMILDGIGKGGTLKVFDFSWNAIQMHNVQAIAKIFKQTDSLIHADFSFCSLPSQSIPILSAALTDNHQLHLHFQGNSGYISPRGFLMPTAREYHQYPLPLLRGIIRKIDGVKPQKTNQYNSNGERDVCWICGSWQQKLFQFNCDSGAVKQCFIHFQHQKYEGIKMQLRQDGQFFELLRMCPIGIIRFFFTASYSIGQRYITTSPSYGIIPDALNLSYALGNQSITQTISTRNFLQCQYQFDPIDSQDYTSNLQLQPRSTQENSFTQVKKIKIKVKKKVIHQQKMEAKVKEIDQDSEWLKDTNSRDSDQVYIRKCIEFDVANSKITRIIKDSAVLQEFKSMLVNYYRDLKDVFYYLAKTTVNANGVYSISELEFQRFLEEQKYVSKRVTHAKIMLKLYACLSSVDEEQGKIKDNESKLKEKGKKGNESQLISRPQFLQFLIRLAIQKWCTVIPKKKKDSQAQIKILTDRKPSKALKQIKQQEQPQAQPQLLQTQKKLQLPMSLINGIQRTLSSLSRYAQQRRASDWRTQRYLKPQILTIIISYQQLLTSLFEKYAIGKTPKPSKPKRLHGTMTLDQFKNIFIDSDIKRSKQAMKEAQIAWLDAKRLQIEDGITQGLNYQQFLQAMARLSECIWFNPFADPSNPIWQSQSIRKCTPLFLKMQSLLLAIYQRSYDLHTRRLSLLCSQGIFLQEMPLLIEQIRNLSDSQPSLSNPFLKMNAMLMESKEISLKDVVQRLKERIESQVIRKEQEVEQEMEIDVIG